jgi:hypothetical protein
MLPRQRASPQYDHDELLAELKATQEKYYELWDITKSVESDLAAYQKLQEEHRILQQENADNVNKLRALREATRVRDNDKYSVSHPPRQTPKVPNQYSVVPHTPGSNKPVTGPASHWKSSKVACLVVGGALLVGTAFVPGLHERAGLFICSSLQPQCSDPSQQIAACKEKASASERVICYKNALDGYNKCRRGDHDKYGLDWLIRDYGLGNYGLGNPATFVTRQCVDSYGNFEAISRGGFILKFLPDAGLELEPWKIFAGLDTNGDGELSFTELKKHIFDREKCKKVFHKLADKNTYHHYYDLEDERHDTRITFKHFLTEDGVRLIGPDTDENMESSASYAYHFEAFFARGF